MSLYQVHKLLFDIHNDPLRTELFDKDPERLYAFYDLAPEELEAIRRTDVTRLFEMGAQPLLLRPLTLRRRVTTADHFAALARASNYCRPREY